MLRFTLEFVLLLLTASITFATSSATLDHGYVEYPEVQIPHSVKYIGVLTESWKGDVFYAFRGIPYAMPPIGERRFRDPEPLKNSTQNEFDARFEGNDCPSIYAQNPSEDCLFLNVYTKLRSPENRTLSSVIAFIHPGGLYIGSGLSSFMGPQYLMAKDIILVTFNYRLGALGFLNLGTRRVPGNAGFKDQVLALRWIKNNIEHFGGNPNDITLMGYSAGALSVSLHLVSPMSENLFNKVIIMSGSIPPQLTIPKHHQMMLAKKQASILDCDSSDSNDILDCLNKFSGKEISNTLRKMFAFGRDNPIFLWLPVIEEDFGQERFLIEGFYDAVKNGRFAKIPLLYGFTNGELCTSAKDIITHKNLLMHFTSDFDQLAPQLFMYDIFSSKDRVMNISNSLRQRYLPTMADNFIDFRALCDLFSDTIIRFGQHKLAQIVSSHNVSTYAYRFSYRGRHSNLHFSWDNQRRQMAEHMDDLMYLFRTFPHTFTPTDPEAHVVEMMTNFFTEFARTGKPAPFNSFNSTFAEITGAKISIKNGVNFQNAKFYEKLFES